MLNMNWSDAQPARKGEFQSFGACPLFFHRDLPHSGLGAGATVPLNYVRMRSRVVAGTTGDLNLPASDMNQQMH